MKEDLSEQLYIESIKTIYSQNKGVSSLSFPATGFLLIYIWGRSEALTLAHYIWYVCLVSVSLISYLIIRRVKLESNISYKLAKNYAQELCLINIMISLVISIFFIHIDLVSDRFAYFGLLYLGAHVVISALAMSLNTPSYLSFVLPQVFAGIYCYSGSEYWAEFLVCLIASGLFATGILRVSNKNFKNSFLLRHENRELLHEVHSKKEIAEKANTSKTRFLASASHDLRQPLQSITLLLAALSHHVSEAKQVSILNKARESVNSLSELLNSLLDISKLDSGLISKQPVYFSLSDLLKDEIERYSAQADSKNLEIYDMVGNDISVFSDPMLIKRIVSNLLDNAINYTHQGTIIVSALRSEDSISIKVQDTGVGISEVEQSNIFQEFYQLGNPERDRRKGLGLGLSIVERLSKILDAKITLKSDSSGSIFQLDLPNLDYKGQNEANAPIKAKPVANKHLDKLDGLKVLLVDDEVDVRESMEWLLESWGCISISGANDDDVMAKLNKTKRENISAILVDYRLRNKQTGLDCAESLMRQLGKVLPTIVITGDTEGEALQKIGASGHFLMHKPIEPNKLFKLLEEIDLKQQSTPNLVQ